MRITPGNGGYLSSPPQSIGTPQPVPSSFRGARRASPESITTGDCCWRRSSTPSCPRRRPVVMDSGLSPAGCPGMTTVLVRPFGAPPPRSLVAGVLHEMPSSVFRKIYSDLQKYPLTSTPNHLHGTRHPASPKRGVRPIVTRRETGMRWTRVCATTERADADGEIVWS